MFSKLHHHQNKIITAIVDGELCLTVEEILKIMKMKMITLLKC